MYISKEVIYSFWPRVFFVYPLGRRNEKERKKREWSGHYMKNAAQFAKTRSIPRAPLSFPRFLFTAPASSALNVPGSLMEPTWPWAHLENRIPNLTANFALPRLLEFLHWTSRRWSRLHLSKTSWPKDCKKNIYIYIKRQRKFIFPHNSLALLKKEYFCMKTEKN